MAQISSGIECVYYQTATMRKSLRTMQENIKTGIIIDHCTSKIPDSSLSMTCFVGIYNHSKFIRSGDATEDAAPILVPNPKRQDIRLAPHLGR
jgi:hypothetical protein